MRAKELIYREDVEKILCDEMQRLKEAYEYYEYSFYLDFYAEIDQLYKLIGKVPTIKEAKTMTIENNKTLEITDPEILQDYIKGKWWVFLAYDTYRAHRDKLPTVVRCKDCKYYKPMQELDGDGNVTFTYDNGACTRGRECHREWEAVTGEDYCSKGKRREDNDNG